MGKTLNRIAGSLALVGTAFGNVDIKTPIQTAETSKQAEFTRAADPILAKVRFSVGNIAEAAENNDALARQMVKVAIEQLGDKENRSSIQIGGEIEITAQQLTPTLAQSMAKEILASGLEGGPFIDIKWNANISKIPETKAVIDFQQAILSALKLSGEKGVKIAKQIEASILSENVKSYAIIARNETAAKGKPSEATLTAMKDDIAKLEALLKERKAAYSLAGLAYIYYSAAIEMDSQWEGKYKTERSDAASKAWAYTAYALLYKQKALLQNRKAVESFEDYIQYCNEGGGNPFGAAGNKALSMEQRQAISNYFLENAQRGFLTGEASTWLNALGKYYFLPEAQKKSDSSVMYNHLMALAEAATTSAKKEVVVSSTEAIYTFYKEGDSIRVVQSYYEDKWDIGVIHGKSLLAVMKPYLERLALAYGSESISVIADKNINTYRQFNNDLQVASTVN